MATKQTALIPALSREQCRAVDRYAIEELSIPGVVLMENAGRNSADLIERWARDRVRKRLGVTILSSIPQVCVVCGKGNNGGDGFVVARQLANRGWPVSVDLAAETSSLTGDAATNCRIAERMGIPVRELKNTAALDEAAAEWRQAVVIIDALLGTGFAGEVREPLAGIIERMNAISGERSSGGPLMVAIDVPSGLDADTGMASGPAVKADRTITFLASKIGYQNKNARGYLGRVTVCDIGAPAALILERLGIGNRDRG